MTALHTSGDGRRDVSGDGQRDVASGPRRWPLLAQPPLLAPYVFVVVALHVLLIGVAVTHTTWRGQALLVFGALLACGVISIEASRRLGMPAGVSRDLLSAWWLPAALLLQPVYALLMPIPLQILLQLRVRRTMLHRRLIVMAAYGLAGAAASVAFHAVIPHPLRDAAEWLTDLEAMIPTVVVCAVLFTVINTAIVVVAAHIANPESSWRQVLWNREILLLDVVEVCVGILITISCALSPLLLVIALPPVMLLQRSLMHSQLQAAARLDAKTGLLNAATWQLEADTEITRAVRTDESLALLLIDIDHFKRVNDAYGHLTGDQVLAGVAATLVQQLREYDVVGRFGGEEFAVLLPNADMLEACRVAERLRSRVGRMCVPADDATITVTISIGVAMFRTHGHDLIELLASADLALYRAKESGRNRICLPATKKAGERRRITARPSPRRL
jgi:diguanylate cyclase (GGDEF)-like protein